MTPPTILVADDDTTLLRFITRNLESLSATVLSAATPAQALELAKAHHPSLAILDIDFKDDIDGYKLSRQLAETSGGGPDVVFFSGVFTRQEDRLKGYEFGAIAFYAKPMAMDWLKSEVQFLLREPQPLLQFTGPDGGPSSSASAKKVLVVEDTEENAKALCLHLEHAGFMPYWASKGAHAVAAARKIRPDAIVLDVGLPDLSGTEVHRLLRVHPTTRHVPIVVWTGSKDGRIETEFLKDAEADYVIKGVNPMESVPARINRLLDRKPQATAADGSLERGCVKLDTVRRSVWVRGKLMCDNLGPKQLGVLRALLQHDGPVKREALRDIVWDGNENPKTIDVTIGRLRESLGDKKEEIIVSVPGGYRLIG